MKKLISMLVAAVLLISCIPTAYAVDSSRNYLFELSVDGSDTKQVRTGDIITVVFTLYRTDSDESYDMHAMQNEIRYDSEFFKLVENSALLSSGITTTEIGLRDTYREFYMNFVSLSGGESWPAQRMIGSFQLEVIATSGATKITNQDYLVSTADGMDAYSAACQDVTVLVSTDCTVTFESNGGSKVSAQVVQYGEKVARPDHPVREGYAFQGWYSDIDLQNPWDFDSDTVQGNITLYAKWQARDGALVTPESPSDGGNSGLWWLLALGVLALLLLVLLLLGSKKTVRFETDCETAIKNQKVKKDGLIERPQEPERENRSFAGWYSDEARTVRWDFENDKVKNNMTLYAKWL